MKVLERVRSGEDCIWGDRQAMIMITINGGSVIMIMIGIGGKGSDQVAGVRVGTFES